jgi:hypothetical protein
LTNPACLKSWPCSSHSQGREEKKESRKAQPTNNLTAAYYLLNPRTHLQKVVQTGVFFLLKHLI